MSTTLLTIRTDVRSRLDESTAHMWSDSELNTWINEGLRDVARRTETLLAYYTSIPVVPNTAKYLMPTDVIRVHRVEFSPAGDDSVYTLQASTYQEMDSVWGIRQNTQSSIPSHYVMWGTAGPVGMTMQLYRVPSEAGTLNIYYYRLPKTLSASTDVAEISEGWVDLVSLYCEYVALRKDRDPRWQEAKQLYESDITNMINVTRQLHDQARSITVGNMAVPSWLYEFDD